jgi:hypothetical protein
MHCATATHHKIKIPALTNNSIWIMSAFTFSAPIVTPEEEQAEREALPEEERQRIHEEVYGSEIEIKETDAMAEKAILLLHEALDEIPDSAKQAYLEASKRAPLLVERESAPIRFLRCEKYNAWAAARRLVSYWEARKKIFGPDRAFLPMTQTGAMAEDMEYAEKALITMLPDDDYGRPVLCWDRIRSVATVAPRASLIRCCFYVMQVLSEQERAQKRGYVTVANYRVSGTAGSDVCLELEVPIKSSFCLNLLSLCTYRDTMYTSTSIEHSPRIWG